MSQTRWHTLFRRAVYGPVVNPDVDPSRALVDPGELGPPDLVAHEVRHYLAQNPVLRRIFGDAIEVMPFRNPFDFRSFPRLQVYLASDINTEAPTSVAVGQLSVFVGSRWDAQEAEVVEDGQASVATVLNLVKTVLRANRARTLVVVVDGEDQSLANDMRIEPERYLVDVVGERTAFVHELPIIYTLHADRETGRLINLG